MSPQLVLIVAAIGRFPCEPALCNRMRCGPCHAGTTLPWKQGHGVAVQDVVNQKLIMAALMTWRATGAADCPTVNLDATSTIPSDGNTCTASSAAMCTGSSCQALKTLQVRAC
ncbi:unnamed protein product [Prorocentrum cordatum]|uniref:Secreted protein n=1 Tax=Prorocentrum cordatum TaxID=2364126 RepID=A0ABN9XW13_9DINO|nr:unnamed protein product [Polarella glacialis]